MIGLICIAKNEDHYIQEWIDYNIKLGFDHIFIYMNDWRTDIEHPQITKIPFDGLNKQREAYAHWLSIYKNEYDWAAFFDVDEFLVLKRSKTIQEFVSNYINYNGIGINWHIFGNNGHTEIIDGEYSQIKRFTKRATRINNHVKTILNCRSNLEMDVHNPSGQIISPNGILFSGSFNENASDDIAQLNHYYCKTKEEFIKKCERGRADTATYRNTYEINYHPHNFNEVEDMHAYNFMYG